MANLIFSRSKKPPKNINWIEEGDQAILNKMRKALGEKLHPDRLLVPILPYLNEVNRKLEEADPKTKINQNKITR